MEKGGRVEGEEWRKKRCGVRGEGKGGSMGMDEDK